MRSSLPLRTYWVFARRCRPGATVLISGTNDEVVLGLGPLEGFPLRWEEIGASSLSARMSSDDSMPNVLKASLNAKSLLHHSPKQFWTREGAVADRFYYFLVIFDRARLFKIFLSFLCCLTDQTVIACSDLGGLTKFDKWSDFLSICNQFYKQV